MKIGILSFRPADERASAEELMMQKVAREKGHKAQIYRAYRFMMIYDQSSPWLMYDGKPFGKCDVVITRPSVLRDVDLRAPLIEQMEMMKIPLFNNYHSILKAKNKLKTMQILDHYGIPLPKTVVVHRQDDLVEAVKVLGGFPVIVKTPFGTFGRGVSIVESMRALKSFLLWDQPLYLMQEFVRYAKGKDLRIFVVNGKAIGSMMRTARKGEFRANIELGGVGVPVVATNEEISIAIRSVQALDLNYGGVDIIRGKSGPVVLEVNSNPGFKELQRATGANVAEALVDYAVEFARRPN